ALRSLLSHALALAAFLTASGTVAQAQNTYTWNNYDGSGNTLWSTPGNWLPSTGAVPGTDTVLIFNTSDALQPLAGYTSTFDSTFDVNALTFNGSASGSTPILLTGSGAASTIRFNLSSTNVRPTLTQNGTSAV